MNEQIYYYDVPMSNEDKILGIKEFIEDAEEQVLYAPEKRIPGMGNWSKADIIRDIKEAKRQLKQLTKREEV